MQTGQTIAARLAAKRCDTDIALVRQVWPQDAPDAQGRDLLKPSDHQAIRRAAAALDRIGEVLVRRLAAAGATTHRALPLIAPGTRVRRAPKCLWLEIALGDPVGDWADHAVLFVAFSRTAARVGIRLPTDRAPDRGMKRVLRRYAAARTDAATGWTLDRRRAPADQAACSSDLNAWLADRARARLRDSGALTLNRVCAAPDPAVDRLLQDLTEASEILSEMAGTAIGTAIGAGTATEAFGTRPMAACQT